MSLTSEVEIPADQVVSDEIPASLWNMLPANGKYIKTVLDFSGYTTCEPFLTMKDHKDLQPAFDCVRENENLLNGDDDLERFKKNPSQVKLLPGHMKLMDKFIDKVKSLKRNLSTSDHPPSKTKRRNVPKAKAEESTPDDNSDENSVLATLRNNMETWFKTVPNAETIAGANKFTSSMQTVLFELSKSPLQGATPTPTFTCQVCDHRLTITRSQTKGLYILSNVQRHITKNCWISKSSAKVAQKSPQGSKQDFFSPKSGQTKSSSSSSSNQGAGQTIVVIGDESDTFAWRTSPTIVAEDVIGNTEVRFDITPLKHKEQRTIDAKDDDPSDDYQEQLTDTTETAGGNLDDQQPSTSNAVMKNESKN